MAKLCSFTDDMQSTTVSISALTITIPGEMRGKGRPRFLYRGGHVRAYTDAETVSAENWVKSCAVEQVGTPMLIGPIRLTVSIGVSVPKSWTKKKQAAAMQQTIRPTGKPDADNMAKLIADALNGIVWKDDSQIVDLSVIKNYSAKPFTLLQVLAL